MVENIKILESEQGIKIIFRQVAYTELVHCGFMINTGSRHEDLKNNGMAHFIEHSVFKGTKKRNTTQILQSLEKFGGEINAYTTREKTCFYATTLRNYFHSAVDILSDIVFNSTFPEQELKKEKQVIFEEIDMYEDTPDESIYDDFYQKLFPKHPLGFNILGTKEVLNKIGKKEITSFIKKNYTKDNLVFSVAGNIKEKEVLQYCNKFFGEIENKQKGTIQAPEINDKFIINEKKDFSQLHAVLGRQSYSKYDERRFPMSMVNNILGGQGMSAKLNLRIREKNGLVYSISSNYSTYVDVGTFIIYYACDEKSNKKVLDLIHQELNKFIKSGISENKLKEYKNQVYGGFAMMQENVSFLMQQQARNYLDFGRFYSLKNFKEIIENISVDDIKRVSEEMLHPEDLNTLTYHSNQNK